MQYDYTQVKAKTPEGYEPHVVVYLHGSSEPVELGHVETHRDPDDPWIRFESLTEEHAGDDVDPEDRWIHVHESNIARIEVRIRQIPLDLKDSVSPTIVGFSYAETDEPSDTSDG